MRKAQKTWDYLVWKRKDGEGTWNHRTVQLDETLGVIGSEPLHAFRMIIAFKGVKIKKSFLRRGW